MRKCFLSWKAKNGFIWDSKLIHLLPKTNMTIIFTTAQQRRYLTKQKEIDQQFFWKTVKLSWWGVHCMNLKWCPMAHALTTDWWLIGVNWKRELNGPLKIGTISKFVWPLIFRVHNRGETSHDVLLRSSLLNLIDFFFLGRYSKRLFLILI